MTSEEIDECINFCKRLIDQYNFSINDEEIAEIKLGKYEHDLLMQTVGVLNKHNGTGQDEQKSVDSDALKLPAGFFDNPLAITSKDLVGIPDDLLLELSNLDDTETAILKLFELAKGPLILDKVIAGLYHLTKVSYERHALTAKLYRMTKKNLLISVPKKKGVYSLPPEDLDEY